MAEASDCIFCRIVRDEAPSYRVCEDALTITFLDIFPVAEGHTLIVTREHAESLFEVSQEALRAVADASRRVAGAIRATLEPDGLGVYQLNGAAAGQTVFHYHMHLIPRRGGPPPRGVRGSQPIHTREAGDPERLRELAGRLAAALEEAPG